MPSLSKPACTTICEENVNDQLPIETYGPLLTTNSEYKHLQSCFDADKLLQV